jgi:tRNA-dihydrouridine synthase A
MLTTGALIHGNARFHLEYNDAEHPIALQLGGSEPEDMAKAVKIAEPYKYDEYNINCGCPSDRVQRGAFGACLMAEPERVANCVDAMKQVTDTPVTVKTRIGIDEQDSYQFLVDFVGTIAEKGCELFTIHARKAWLNGLSPKDNRTIPPLNWERVYQLKRDFPHLKIELNGGVKTIDHMNEAAQNCDGVMIGREAYQNPYLLAEIERAFYGNVSPLTRPGVAAALKPYIDAEIEAGTKLKDITRHILGLFHGEYGGKLWRRTLSEKAHSGDFGSELLDLALSHTKR